MLLYFAVDKAKKRENESGTRNPLKIADRFSLELVFTDSPQLTMNCTEWEISLQFSDANQFDSAWFIASNQFSHRYSETSVDVSVESLQINFPIATLKRVLM